MAELNYHHLRYFRAVANEGNLTRAAARLNVSQSALSVQIRQLEDRLGHALFYRAGRGLELTEAGRIALDHAETIFSTGEELLAVLSREGEANPALRIGALATLSRNFLLAFLRPALNQGVPVTLRSGTTAELLRMLHTLALDMIVLNQPPADGLSAGLVSHRLAEQGTSLIGTVNVISGMQGLEALLRSRRIILPTEHSGVRVGFDALCVRLGIVPDIAVEADDMAMVRLLAREGVGLAVIPPIVVRDELTDGTLVETNRLPTITEGFYAVTGERRFPHAYVARLLDRASQIDLDGQTDHH